MKKIISKKDYLPGFIPVGLIITALLFPGSGRSETAPGMTLTSPAFLEGGMIPPKYLLRTGNVSPPLLIGGIPAGTKSLALVVNDPDAPRGDWVHWVLYDIPVVSRIEAGTAPGREGINDFKRPEYDGPSPPSGTHHYYFTIYALDRRLDLKVGATRPELERAMRGHILARARLVGLARKD